MKESQEFKERKALIERQLEADQVKHNLKMEQLAFERENSRLFHERELERGRIKRAEEYKLISFRNSENRRARE